MRICIFGAGGFGHELVAPLEKRYSRSHAGASIVFVDDNPCREATLPVISLQETNSDDQFIIAIGDGSIRQTAEARCLERGLKPFNYAGSCVSLGAGVVLADGFVLCDFSMVTATATIGRQFQSNIYSYVAHDYVIGDFVTFAPRVSCNGNVHIDDFAYIGTGAIIRNGTPERPLKIGKNAIVGMGAVVTKDVPPGATVIGNPARMRDEHG